MRLLLSVHQFFPKYYTGTEGLVLCTAKQLMRMGHEVLVFTALPLRANEDESFEEFEYEFEGVRVVGVAVPDFKRDRTDPMLAEYYNSDVRPAFERAIELFSPDLVHFFHFRNISLVCADICLELNIPWLFTPTDFWFVCPTTRLMLPDNKICTGPMATGENCLQHILWERGGSIFEKLPVSIYKACIKASNLLPNIGTVVSGMRSLSERSNSIRLRLKNARRICISSEVMCAQLQALFPDLVNVTRVRFGVDFADPLPPSASEMLRIGFIGTLSHHKGAHVLLKALSLLPATESVEVMLYGDESIDPEYSKQLRILAAASKHRVNFMGVFPMSEINRVFASFDVLVIPSMWPENNPLVASAALFYRCPLVASDMGGLSDMIEHGDSGLLFEAGNEMALAEHISELCRTSQNRLQSMRKNMPAPRSSHDFAGEMVDIYMDAVS